jgi:hypothetical protein
MQTIHARVVFEMNQNPSFIPFLKGSGTIPFIKNRGTEKMNKASSNQDDIENVDLKKGSKYESFAKKPQVIKNTRAPRFVKKYGKKYSSLFIKSFKSFCSHQFESHTLNYSYQENNSHCSSRYPFRPCCINPFKDSCFANSVLIPLPSAA